jgi:RHH-type proline utilization regulon transcriptional repressor/proline dehydrogenase/delta 1-pyrroline-5-carboxylate dehydrogenase
MPSPPFHAFARSIQPQSALREAIAAAWRRPETACLPPLLEQASLPPEQTVRARALASRLVEALRAKTPSGGVEGLIHE